ncbi:hypothetical protein DFAR_980001 [Desulfarculales bacterium]
MAQIVAGIVKSKLVTDLVDEIIRAIQQAKVQAGNRAA